MTKRFLSWGYTDTKKNQQTSVTAVKEQAVRSICFEKFDALRNEQLMLTLRQLLILKEYAQYLQESIKSDVDLYGDILQSRPHWCHRSERLMSLKRGFLAFCQELEEDKIDRRPLANFLHDVGMLRKLAERISVYEEELLWDFYNLDEGTID